MNRCILATSVASLLTHVSLTYAQQVSTDETMIVTANRFEQSESSVLSAISVVTREDIETIQAKSVAEALLRVPGVEVTSNGGRGQSTSILIRGTNSSHTLALVDGVRVSSSVGTGVPISQFPIGLIERIEVIRGPAAVQYGSDAIGGVINIITRSERGDERKQISLGTGSLGHKEASFVAKADTGDKGYLQLAGGFDTIDGYNVHPTNVNSQDKHGSEAKNIFASYAHDFSQETQGYLSARWFENQAEYDVSNKKNIGESEKSTVSAQLDHARGSWKTLLQGSYQSVKSRNYTQDEGRDNASTHATTDMVNVQWANMYQVTQEVELGAGVDWRHESLDDHATSYGSPNALAGESRSNRGAFASASYQYQALTLQGNARYDQHDKYEHYTTWSTSAGYQINDSHRARISYGTAFKAPTYSALLTSPDLKPEESKNLELGLSGDYMFFQWNLSLYDNEIKNLNFWYVDPSEVFGGKTLNVDARIKGAELDVQFNTGPLHHTLVLEHKDHKDSEGTPLARRAKENYKWIGDLYLGDFNVNAVYTLTGRRPDLPAVNLTESDYLPAYDLLDLSVSYFISRDFTLSGKISNALDENYETAKGYPAPERAYYVNASYQF
ncbi:TonB-dependent receptor domain-containing protein [Vibrio ostreicida]|uniref:TonB-dependent receptor domain-containing protein n=1 Tax=Vibrio ostreicida TaxID=526588 RepID=UPI0009708BCB|nr:TonB-dependent receptor [Vibrio ostreicida]